MVRAGRPGGRGTRWPDGFHQHAGRSDRPVPLRRGRIFQEPSNYILRIVNGPCNIAVGQSMLLPVSSVVHVCSLVEQLQIPLEILHEDDVVVSFLIGRGTFVHWGYAAQKYSLPSPNARWHRHDHIARRNRTADWILKCLAGVSSTTNFPQHLHFPSTTDDTLPTSEPIGLQK